MGISLLVCAVIFWRRMAHWWNRVIARTRLRIRGRVWNRRRTLHFETCAARLMLNAESPIAESFHFANVAEDSAAGGASAVIDTMSLDSAAAQRPADSFATEFGPSPATPEGESPGCDLMDGTCFEFVFGSGAADAGVDEVAGTDSGRDIGGNVDGYAECTPLNENRDCLDIGGDGNDGTLGGDSPGIDTSGSDTSGGDTRGTETADSGAADSDDGHDLTDGGTTEGQTLGGAECTPLNEDRDCLDLGGTGAEDTVGGDTSGGDTSGNDTFGNDTFGTDDFGASTAGIEGGHDTDGIDTAEGDGDGSEGDDMRGGDISGSDTSGNDISGLDTSGTEISGADTSGVEVSGLDTSGTDTFGADTSGAETSGTEGSGHDTFGADTSGNNTSGVDTSGVDTSGIDVTGADTSGTETGGVETSGTEGSGHDTFGLDTIGTETSGDDMSGVETSGIDVAGADTSGADTSGSDTSGSDTSGSATSGAETSGTDSSGGEMSGTDTVGVDTSGTETVGIETSGTEVSGNDTFGSETSGSNTSGDEVSGTSTVGSDTSGTEGSGNETAGVDTSGVDTSGSDNSGTETSGVDTSGAETSGAETSGEDLSGTGGTEIGGTETGGTDPCSGEETNAPPVAQHDPTQDEDPNTALPNSEYSVGHKQLLDVSAAGVLLNDSDPNMCDSLVAVLVNDPGHGTVTLNPDGSLRYDPDDDFAGHDSFTYKANDGTEDSNEATVYVHVTNSLPVAVDDAYSAVSESKLSVKAAAGVLANDSDPDDDPLKAVLVTNPAHGQLSLSNDGSFTYTSYRGFSGDDTFTYRADDGMDQSNLATVTIDVLRPEPDVDTDSDNDGNLDRSQAEDDVEMTAPGNILRLNFDDDNGNCVPDSDEAPLVDSRGNPVVDDELELVAVDIDTAGIDVTGFKLTLTVSGPISIWATQDKRPLAKTSFTIGTDEIPSSVFVEGVGSGDAQIHWTLFNTQNVLVARDIVRFTNLDVDLRAYRPQTEGAGYGKPFQRWLIPADQEDHVGIRRNGDDDNRDSVPDGIQLNPVANENDTIEIEIKSVLPNTAGVQMRIRRSNANINVFAGSDRSGPISFVLGNSALITQTTLWVDWFGLNADTAATLSVEVIDENSGNTAFVADVIAVVPFTSTVIIFDGEFQNIADPPNYPGQQGMIELAINEYRNSGYDVHLYEESDYTNQDIRQGPAWQEVVNAIMNRGVTDVAIRGYSHGGGDTYLLAEAMANSRGVILNPFRIPLTGYVDGITQPFVNATAENRRPPLSQFHVNQYQLNTLPHGGPSDGDDDLNRSGLGVVHVTIEDHMDVIELLHQRLLQKVNR